MDTFACNDEQCCNADHHSDIDSLYMHIVNSLFNSGIRFFGANERNHHRTVPGWNKHVADLHALQEVVMRGGGIVASHITV